MSHYIARPATKADETPEFKEFWSVWYPVKSEYEGRAHARDRFFFHVWCRDADPQDIVDAAKWYANNFKPAQKRMKAATWLDNGCYEDDAERQRDAQKRIQERQKNVVPMTAQPTGQTAFLKAFNKRKQESA